jgi:hypothetical protein
MKWHAAPTRTLKWDVAPRYESFATPEFWARYRKLPVEIRDLADKNFALLRQSPQHPSLRLKKIGNLWSARVGLHYRVLTKERTEGLVWFWIGHHGEYDSILKK